MKSNPKTIAGVVVLVILAIGFGFLLSRMIPTAAEVQREMSLTPTPLPPVPGSVRAAGYVEQDTPEPALGTGSRGDKVTRLQERLKALGYYDGEIDGQFGQGTQEAVIAFQMKNGLDADGYAGEKTQALLYSDEAVRNDNEE